MLVALALVVASLWAVQPDEMLSNPALGSPRPRAVRRNCAAWCARTNRSTTSEAPLAHDLRVLVRERIKAGDSDAQMLDFLVARYGEFVLLKPRLSWHTAALWGLPPGLLLVGIIMTCHCRAAAQRRYRRSGRSLTPAEEARVTEILRGDRRLLSRSGHFQLPGLNRLSDLM